MHRIAVVLVAPVMSFDATVPQLVLGGVAVDGAPAYDLLPCALDPGRPVETVGGLDMVAPHGLDAVGRADSVLVVGSGGREDLDPRLTSALRDAAAAGKRIAAICTGVFVLAQAGLLDGRRATTHWGLAADLARRHPAVEVLPDVLYVADGPMLTSAGAAAGIELCLHLIRADHGAAAAGEAARLAVAAPRPGDQPQVPSRPLPPEPDASAAATRAWALGRLGSPITLAELAAHARVSPRTLTRRFQEETGLSPVRWLLHQRVERARELLESTTLPMDRVAHLSGLGSADSLRQHLVRRVGVTPSAYRAVHARRIGPPASDVPELGGRRGPQSGPGTYEITLHK